MYGYQILQNFVQTYTLFFIGNPLICDCELRWYHQWIEEEWNPVEEQWLKETFCKDPADNQRHNIAEVPLKDMFCTGDVTDKPSARVSSNTNLNAYSAILSPRTLKNSGQQQTFLARKKNFEKKEEERWLQCSSEYLNKHLMSF